MIGKGPTTTPPDNRLRPSSGSPYGVKERCVRRRPDFEAYEPKGMVQSLLRSQGAVPGNPRPRGWGCLLGAGGMLENEEKVGWGSLREETSMISWGCPGKTTRKRMFLSSKPIILVGPANRLIPCRLAKIAIKNNILYTILRREAS